MTHKLAEGESFSIVTADGKRVNLPEDLMAAYPFAEPTFALGEWTFSGTEAPSGYHWEVRVADPVDGGLYLYAVPDGTSDVSGIAPTQFEDPGNAPLDAISVRFLNGVTATRSYVCTLAPFKNNQVEMGKWTILRDGVNVTAQVVQPLFVDDEWSVESVIVDGDVSDLHFVEGDENSVSLEWTANSGAISYTATRPPSAFTVSVSASPVTDTMRDLWFVVKADATAPTITWGSEFDRFNGGSAAAIAPTANTANIYHIYEYESGKLAVSKQGIAANYATRAELEAGWWSDWTATVVSAENISVTGLPYYVPYDGEHPESFGWHLPTSQGPIRLTDESEADVLSFNEHVDDWYLNYTATRHRVAAPVPTKPEDIGAQPAGNYLTQHQQLTLIYGGNGKRFSEWAFNGIPEGSTNIELSDATGTWILGFSYDNDYWGAEDLSSHTATSLSLTAMSMSGDHEDEYIVTATRTENPIIGYTLGSQMDKPLAALSGLVFEAGSGAHSAQQRGTGAVASGNNSVAIGADNISGAATPDQGDELRYASAEGYASYAEGAAHAVGDYSHAEGGGNAVLTGDWAGHPTVPTATGKYSHAEGTHTWAKGDNSHAEGDTTLAEGIHSHAEGGENKSIGDYSHTEGKKNVANGNLSHVEGWSNTGRGEGSHVEGKSNTINGTGDSNHIEGKNNKITTAGGRNPYSAHVEGNENEAQGIISHAEGYKTIVKGEASHTEGSWTRTSNNFEHAQGRFNVSHTSNNAYPHANNTIHSVGIGTSDSARSNAVETMQDGKTFILGIGGYDGTNPTGQPNAAQDLATVVEGKLDSSSAAPEFDSTKTYLPGDYVTYNGGLYRFTATHPAGAWNSAHVAAQDMTSPPDATVDITGDGALRVTAADGSVLWRQGYNLSTESSAVLVCDKVGIFAFAAPFSDATAYAKDDRVTYDGKPYKFNAKHSAGAWDGTDADEEMFTMPTAAAGKVGDFGVCIDNTANASGVVKIDLSGLDSTFSVVVPKGQSVVDMLAFEAGELAVLYFTLTPFRVNSLLTWQVLKQVVENGGAQS